MQLKEKCLVKDTKKRSSWKLIFDLEDLWSNTELSALTRKEIM